jgi:TRAP-type C4-dicarboxylate transport system substrate-binding protein
MWDGWWFLINRKMWQTVPADLRDKVAAIINKNAVDQRDEIAKQNSSLKGDLAAKGLVFNDVDPASFRETLTKSGFYSEWKTKFGDDAWALLEDAAGKLG